MKNWLIGLVFGLLGIGAAVAQLTVFPLQSAVLGTEYLQNLANPTGAFFTTQQIATFIQSGAATGTINVAHGGTGAATLTAHGVLLGEGTSPVTPVAVGTTGQLLQGATGADPAWATTLSGSYTFTNALNQFGSASGVPAHISTAATTAPALTSCGTGSPAITGTDTAGIVTLGTSATGCVITFNVAYTGTPYCVVSWIATPLASQSYVTANTAITLTQTSASGNKVQYICVGTAGG